MGQQKEESWCLVLVHLFKEVMAWARVISITGHTE